MKEEIWRPVKGYEGYYEVSNCGNVRSVDRIVTYSDGRKRLHKGRVLKPSKNSDGYLICKLCKNGQKKTVKIHRLVAEAFINNPSNLPEVNHKDENKNNNCVSNLEFCSHLYNMRYGTARQRMVEKTSKHLLQLDKDTNEIIAEYPSTMKAERQLNISNGSISKCCNGKLKTYKGYKWQYKKE